jgi:ABC-type sugar transport system substrate-binding protein
MKLHWFAVLIFFHTKCFAADLHIAFIVPDKKEHRFWQLVVDVAQSIASDQNIKLNVFYSDTNRFASLSAVQAITEMADKPDYIIYRPMQGTALNVLQILESSKIPFVTLEQGFSAEELLTIGEPQKKYKYWLGSIQYDDEEGGAQLTQALFKHHQRNNPDKPMYVTGIAGGFEQVSVARQASLKQITKRSGPIIVNQIFPMSWSIDNIKQNFPAIYGRYPQTNAFWCIADSFALAVIEQLGIANSSDQNILIGGFDWLPEAIDKIQTGEMTASVGGHFLMVGKAILNIVEYHYGNNVFLNANQVEKYEVIDQDNVKVYQPFMKKAPWPEIDYRQFSSRFNPQKKPVKLSMANLISAYSQLEGSNK